MKAYLTLAAVIASCLLILFGWSRVQSIWQGAINMAASQCKAAVDDATATLKEKHAAELRADQEQIEALRSGNAIAEQQLKDVMAAQHQTVAGIEIKAGPDGQCRLPPEMVKVLNAEARKK